MDFKEFQDMKKWQDYVWKHMNEADRKDSMFHITVSDKRGNVIAKWNKGEGGSGQIWEKRSKERLEND